jgi:hypothetical protein
LAGRQTSKEATLGEVLSEVSLADLGRKLKSGAIWTACWLVFCGFILVVTSAGKDAGYDIEQTGIPDRVFWLIMAWAFTYVATSERSYHEVKESWYFPRLGWFSSLLLAAYLLGFVYLLIEIAKMEIGLERGVAFGAVWIGYSSPFIFFLSVIAVGHSNLMDKRNAPGPTSGTSI